ncbi:hypothetical protein [Photobacterium galatheae]|uniref:Uncharacterized protein n=1 Tax=Photobacterium galatheae TaxID=1654360 RepID=A0A066RI23_9GAMM|nr:hypothetical protein [Photobacterium galatheae]KDM89974.1 hypothetical protein EA58_19715 [Photobacterium galatheae]MCM0149231.1 hypothetical protein [Photobacterium galatheae]
MSHKISSINQKIKEEIGEFIDIFNHIDVDNLDEASIHELLTIIEDFKSDISDLSNLEVLSQNLEATLQAGLANTLTKDMKLSSEHNLKLKSEAEKIENQKSNHLGYDKLQRD